MKGGYTGTVRNGVGTRATFLQATPNGRLRTTSASDNLIVEVVRHKIHDGSEWVSVRVIDTHRAESHSLYQGKESDLIHLIAQRNDER